MANEFMRLIKGLFLTNFYCTVSRSCLSTARSAAAPARLLARR